MIRRCACSPDCPREVWGKRVYHQLCFTRHRWQGEKARRQQERAAEDAWIEARYQQALAEIRRGRAA